jgi:hypothetical protein
MPAIHEMTATICRTLIQRSIEFMREETAVAPRGANLPCERGEGKAERDSHRRPAKGI